MLKYPQNYANVGNIDFGNGATWRGEATSILSSKIINIEEAEKRKHL